MSPEKMQKMAFPGPQISKFSGGACPQTPLEGDASGSRKYHFIQEQVEKGTVELQYCPTEEMVADMLTKGLSQEQFIKLRLMSGVTEMPHSACK